MHKVTFALTSCGRPDLLEKTMDSFLEMNTYPIEKYIITEDSGIEGINDLLIKKYDSLNIEWIINKTNIGQLKSVDNMYAKINTKYIFHCEEDWLFTDKSFIEKSMRILENHPRILQVWLRDQSEIINVGKLSITKYSQEFDLIKFNNIGSGFSFNPGLRRLHDYKLIGSYENIYNKNAPHHYECQISMKYRNLEFRTAILKTKHVEHIGWGRHVE
jgi:hypothetical protein